jgi:hypothetical protein
MILRCTQKLLKASGATLSPEPAPSGDALEEWYANVVSLPFPGRSVVMFTHPGTLLTVVAPGRVLRTTVPVFHQRLPELLRRVWVPDSWIAGHAPTPEVHLAKTANRHVLGSMTDHAYTIWYHAELVSGQLNLDDLEMRVAETPMTCLSHSTPERALRKLMITGSPA